MLTLMGGMQDNILFGAAYDEERYKKGKLVALCFHLLDADYPIVIYQCGLKRDLTLFTAGDLTEVGEKVLFPHCL